MLHKISVLINDTPLEGFYAFKTINTLKDTMRTTVTFLFQGKNCFLLKGIYSTKGTYARVKKK